MRSQRCRVKTGCSCSNRLSVTISRRTAGSNRCSCSPGGRRRYSMRVVRHANRPQALGSIMCSHRSLRRGHRRTAGRCCAWVPCAGVRCARIGGPGVGSWRRASHDWIRRCRWDVGYKWRGRTTTPIDFCGDVKVGRCQTFYPFCGIGRQRRCGVGHYCRIGGPVAHCFPPRHLTSRFATRGAQTHNDCQTRGKNLCTHGFRALIGYRDAIEVWDDGHIYCYRGNRDDVGQ